MLITHSVDEKRLSKDIAREAGFLITNKKGGFLNLGISSRYRGLFFGYKEELLKVIDDIRVQGEAKELRNNFWSVVRCHDKLCESFFMPIGTDSLVYELNEEKEVEFFFDVKKPYDNRVWGRNYNVWKESGKIIVEYTKTSDGREDSSNGIKEYTVYLVLDYGKSDAHSEILNQWENQFYSFDKERDSYPYERYTFKGVKIKSDKIIVGFSESKDDALKICANVRKHLERFKTLQKQYTKVSIRNIKTEKINFAMKCAIESLDNLLVTKDQSIHLYAGLPWFFQYWSRDTFISLKALMHDKEYNTVKKILMDSLHYLRDDGLLPNRIPGTGTKSADSIGWYFKRWNDFITLLRKEGQLKNYFTKSEMLFITKKLEDALNKVVMAHTVDNLAMNSDQETWMDSIFNGDGRKGARIEIQALRISMYELVYTLTERKVYKEMKEKLIAKVKEHFWTGDYLKDGMGDTTLRPNLFIAAYLCPDLLSKDEWKRCFNHILPRLWLTWGGLSTIDKADPRFYPTNTGENSASYHRGDSWFWLNNLAALVLFRLDHTHYKFYIDKIVEASSDEILFSGFIGCHSELSSASAFKSQGCLSQAWSSALFVELIEEKYLSN